MANASCATDEQIVAAANSPNGSDVTAGSGEVQSHTQILADENAVAIRAQARLRSLQEALQKELESGNYDPLTTAYKKGLLGAAKRVSKWIDEASAGLAVRKAAHLNAIRAHSGYSTVERSKWLDWSAKLDSVFKNNRAPVVRFFLMYAPELMKSALNNTMVQAYKSMFPRIEGWKQSFDADLKAFITDLKPIADRVGMEMNDLALAIGDYANALHAPEANRALIRKWEHDRQKLVAQAVGDNTKFVRELIRVNRKIGRLKVNIDREDVPDTVHHAGLTNGQAERIKRDVLTHTKITQAEAEAFSARITEMFNKVTEARVKAGLVNQETLAAFPLFQHYVAYHNSLEQLIGPVNDASNFLYDPGTYKARRGSNMRPDSSFLTLQHYMRRSSMELGMQDFSLNLAALADAHPDIFFKANVDQIRAMENGDDPVTGRWARRLLDNGGMVVQLPGEKSRTLVAFKSGWKDDFGNTGRDLNDALLATPKMAASTLGKWATGGTSLYGQLFTRFTPAFAFKNFLMDTFERSFHLAADDVYKPDGTLLKGSSVLGSYFTGVGSSAKMLLDVMSGRAAENSEAMRLWREYKRQGLHQSFTAAMGEKAKTFSDLMEAEQQAAQKRQNALDKWLARPEFKKFASDMKKMGGAGKKLIDRLDSWNDFFNNIAQFNHYVTLRKAGVAEGDAAYHAYASMNLTEGGQYNHVFRMMWPFLKPTVQSGAAMMRALGFSYDPRGFLKANKRGLAYMASSIIAWSLLRPVMEEMLGWDEAGNSRLDLLPISKLSRGPVFGFGDDEGGGYYQQATGYGPNAVAITIGEGLNRMYRGLMEPDDFAIDLLFTVAKNALPGGWPEFKFSEAPADWLMHMFMPTALTPIWQASSDRSYFGSKISRNGAEDLDWRAAYDKGLLSTERFYHWMAKQVNDMIGVQATPETMRTFYDGLMGGPLAALKSVLPADMRLRKRGEEGIFGRLDPFMRGMGIKSFVSSVNNTERSAYYMAKDHYMRKVRDEGIQIADPRGKYGSGGKREFIRQNLIESEAFTQDEIADIIDIFDTEKELTNKASEFSKNFREAFKAADSPEDLQRLMDEAAQAEKEIFVKRASSLNYLRGMKK